MLTGKPARVAVVDLGTNSTRLLVAEVEDGSVRELERRSTVTRLGQGVDASGRLAGEAMERVYETLAAYREAIDAHGAETVVAVATSAVRDAANGDEFRAELKLRFGIDARTISGDEEARLTFLGATSRRAGEPRPTLVIDIGGGSTELVTGTAGRAPSFHVSTQAGSVRQTERHIHSDPPRAGELTALSDEVRAIIQASVPVEVRQDVSEGIAVAGTATSLASIDQALGPDGAEQVDGYRLTIGACRRMTEQLGSIPLSERRRVPGLHPDRAPTIVTGAAILVEAMSAFGLDSVEVSGTDILHGAALASLPTPG
jgi:exopolyphosphatase/guanosine-5'-triphosphate,3'-diphosphate pyrophosphatase